MVEPGRDRLTPKQPELGFSEVSSPERPEVSVSFAKPFLKFCERRSKVGETALEFIERKTGYLEHTEGPNSKGDSD